MKPALFVTLAFAICNSLAAQKSGTVCVAPIPSGPETTAGTPSLLCRSGHLYFKIDARPAVPWPHDTSLKMTDLQLDQTHRVTVLCEGKPQQSFRFRFEKFESSDLCLFMNGFYQTVQLWERHSAPWCKSN